MNDEEELSRKEKFWLIVNGWELRVIIGVWILFEIIIKIMRK